MEGVVICLRCLIADEISEDRMIALRKRAEVDAKYVIMLNPNDNSELKQSLDRFALFFKILYQIFSINNSIIIMHYSPFSGCRLANAFSELANTYYREEGRRVKQRIEKKNVSSVELIVRYCFKVGIHFFLVYF